MDNGLETRPPCQATGRPRATAARLALFMLVWVSFISWPAVSPAQTDASSRRAAAAQTAPDTVPAASPQRPTSAGTGFGIARGLILTAHHVVAGGRDIRVGPLDGRWVRAEIVKTSEPLDLALLRVSADLPSIALSSSSEVPQGLEVVVIGFPQPSVQGLTKKVTNGIVNGLRRGQQGDPRPAYFQISAEVARGNSGGPVIAPDGSVIGMVQRKLNAQQVAARTGDLAVNVAYALPASEIAAFLHDSPAAITTHPLRLDVALRPYQIFSQAQGAVVTVIVRKDKLEEN